MDQQQISFPRISKKRIYSAKQSLRKIALVSRSRTKARNYSALVMLPLARQLVRTNTYSLLASVSRTNYSWVYKPSTGILAVSGLLRKCFRFSWKSVDGKVRRCFSEKN